MLLPADWLAPHHPGRAAVCPRHGEGDDAEEGREFGGIGVVGILDGMAQQSRRFGVVHRQLKRARGKLFATAERELAGRAGSDRRGKPLRSLLRHRDGLCVFVDRPDVPMDNNLMERILRDPVIERKLSFGSDSLEGARYSAMMYGIIETLRMNGIDVRKWLDDWLSACAGNGGQPPEDLSPWLPWLMDEDRRRHLKATR